MNNFNPNILINLLNLQNRQLNTPNPANQVNGKNYSPVNEEIFTPMFSQNQTETKPAQAQNIVYDFEMAKMDSEMLLKYIQSSMKMPNTIEEFLQNNNAQTLKILIKDILNTKILAEFLNQNSTQAIETILKTISSSLKSGITDVGQLKDVLGILTAIQSQTNLNSNALKELMLLYIPLNPAVFDKQVDFLPSSEDIAQEIENSTLSIIFETVNFSNILCCINEADGSLYVSFYCDKGFPFERFSKVIYTVSKEANLNVVLDNKNSRKINKNNPAPSKNLKIISSGFVPASILILAHIIIKSVFKTDEVFGKE